MERTIKRIRLVLITVTLTATLTPVPSLLLPNRRSRYMILPFVMRLRSWLTMVSRIVSSTVWPCPRVLVSIWHCPCNSTEILPFDHNEPITVLHILHQLLVRFYVPVFGVFRGGPSFGGRWSGENCKRGSILRRCLWYLRGDV